MKGAWTPLTTMSATAKSPQMEAPRGIKTTLQIPCLESGPFSVMVQDRKHSQSEDKWGKLYGPLGQWCPGKHHHAEVHK